MNRKHRPRHGGQLLEAVRDEFGLVEVVEHGETRSLHFGNSIEQSSYVPDMPDWLQFEYYRKLMFATAFHDDPKDILLLGLGAGVVARYLLSHMGRMKLTAVEYREAVADMAFIYFGLPRDSRLEVYIAIAGQFLQEFEQSRDIILVDLYDADGLNEEPRRLSFLDSCRTRLGEQGVMAINLWRSDRDEYAFMLDQIYQVFDDNVLLVDADDANTVAYCFRARVPDLSNPQMKARLQERSAALAFDGTEFSGKLYRRGN